MPIFKKSKIFSVSLPQDPGASLISMHTKDVAPVCIALETSYQYFQVWVLGGNGSDHFRFDFVARTVVESTSG